MIRKAKVKTVFEVLQYTGNNWEELDEFAGQKGEYNSVSGWLVFEFGMNDVFVMEGDYLFKALNEDGEMEYNVIKYEKFNKIFELLPLPIEEKIMKEFNAKEEI